jgi:hypothetical protein
MGNADRDYLLQRAEQERLFAKQAASPEATAVHERLAQEYQARAEMDQVAPRAENEVLGLSEAPPQRRQAAEQTSVRLRVQSERP